MNLLSLEPIIIENTTNNLFIPVFTACILIPVILYFAITINITKTQLNKWQKAVRLIHEGHNKAMNGRKDDGIYQETRREHSEA